MTDGQGQGAWPTGGSTLAGCACTASKRAPAPWCCCCTAPRVLVRLAPPASRARQRRLPGGRTRPARLQHLRQAAPDARLPTRALARDMADLIVALGASSATVAGAAAQLVILAFQAPSLPERLVAAWDSGRCAGPWVACRPGRALSPPGHRPLCHRGRPAGCPARRHQLLPGRLAHQPAGPGADLAAGGHPDASHLGTRTATWAGSWPSRTAPGSRRCGSSGIAEASHWVQADAPERVNQLMVESLQPIGG